MSAIALVIDENAARHATRSYDEYARAVSSEHREGTELTTLTFGSNDTTVTGNLTPSATSTCPTT